MNRNRKLSSFRQLSLMTALVALATACSVSGTARQSTQARATPPATVSSAPVVSAKPTRSPAARPKPRVGITGVAGFTAVDVSFVSLDHGFAIGVSSCQGLSCGVLLETTDGARHWTPISRVPAGVEEAGGRHCAGRPCVTALRFVTPEVGYAFKPSLFITIDGGHSWHRQRSDPVTSLEGDATSVLRVTTRTDGCNSDVPRLETSSPGSQRWALVRTLPSDHICPPVLYRQGPKRLELVSFGNPAGCCPAAVLYSSTDAGKHLLRHSDACQLRPDGDGYTRSVALAPGNVLALVCVTRNPSSYGLRVSTDSGGSYSRAKPFSADIATRGDTPVCGLAAASAKRFLVLSGCGPHVTQEFTSEDAGATWSDTNEFGPGLVVLVGFEDELTARVAQNDEIETTLDGGRTWRTDPFLLG